MGNTEKAAPDQTRTASCTCGGLKLTVRGNPSSVYACSCLECQRATGSAFAYRAVFKAEVIAGLEGEARRYRRGSDSGRWVEQTFCPKCGTLVYMSGEALTNAVAVSVGCFADQEFAPPSTLYRAARRHGWYSLRAGIKTVG